MKKFVNNGRGLATIHFEDGSGVFLKRGQSVETDKTVKRTDKGIVEVVVKTAQKASKQAPTSKTSDNSTNTADKA
jgi:hypothetical protein